MSLIRIGLHTVLEILGGEYGRKKKEENWVTPTR
jgi:hypothetical protein